MAAQLSDQQADAPYLTEQQEKRPLPSSDNSITFITTCKGRLHHLQQSLPLLMKERPDEVVVVDYDCPQNAGAWVHSHFRSVKAVKVSNVPTFNLSHARNTGAAYATSRWICFVDADVLVQPGWIAWLRQNMRPGFFYTQALLNNTPRKGTQGTCVCESAAYDAVGKYDDILQGWGGEDDDFYYRLRRQGVQEAKFPYASIAPIHHLNEERTAFYAEKDELKSYTVSRLYRLAKYQAMEFFRSQGELSRDMRRTIYQEVNRKLSGWSVNANDGGTPPAIKITMEGREPLSSTRGFSKKCTIELNLDS